MLRYLIILLGLSLFPIEAVACSCGSPDGGKPMSEFAKRERLSIVLPVDQRLSLKEADARYFPHDVVTTSRVLDPLGLHTGPYLTSFGDTATSCSYNPYIGVVEALSVGVAQDGSYYTAHCIAQSPSYDWLAQYQITRKDVVPPRRADCFIDRDQPTGLEGCDVFGSYWQKGYEWIPEHLGFETADFIERAKAATAKVTIPTTPERSPTAMLDEDETEAYLRSDATPRVSGTPILARFDPERGLRVWVFITNDYDTFRPKVMQADVGDYNWGIGVGALWTVEDGRLKPSLASDWYWLDPTHYKQVMGKPWPENCGMEAYALTDECEALYQAFRDAERALPSRELTPAALAAAYADLPSPPG